MMGADQRCELPQAMSEANVNSLSRLESIINFKHALNHDRCGHDSWLRVFGCCEGGIRAFGNDLGEGVAEEGVHFFKKRFARFRKCVEPGSGHANSLDALAWDVELVD